MPTRHRYLFNRVCLYLIICIIATGVIHLSASSLISRIPTTSSILFPLLTIFLFIFHLTIAYFMAMKYWCNRQRLYLTAIACAFAGSALLMLGTLGSFPQWFLCDPARAVNANDALIFYTFRNIMMMSLFSVAIVLYHFRDNAHLNRTAHIIILACCLSFTALTITLSWLYSSNHPLLSVDFIDNITRVFLPLWYKLIGWTLTLGWLITLLLLISLSRLRNIFWYSGAFFCAAYIVTLLVLLIPHGDMVYAWYHARCFETICTIFMLFILLCDVFTLYRHSNDKYLTSYQNSIRDPLTRLHNRSYFYDALNAQLTKASASQPLSVIVSDLDYFKRINDSYGHVQGDKVIQFTADVLQKNVRPQDVAARIGGEEFALLLVNTGPGDAGAIAERIRLAVNERQDALPERMTISAGVFTAVDGSLSAEECVKRADTAMYEAKSGGRNRVVVWSEVK
ncbi:sensor domain-containing diguanylate cyclase [Raoultella terrigena]|uniref:sensor domain-containing diguanylate cyclase n=1 Tax=Raoultella terrigena TaxID=577 RepID=UPI0009767D40|nr:GGDEF domain-containing protein [Raoultella terrigena]OMP92603.1 GGDEF domain-containing protein [Raoultella terrigena]